MTMLFFPKLKFKKLSLFQLVFILSFSFFYTPHAQALFQNNLQPCEEILVPGEFIDPMIQNFGNPYVSHAVLCSQFNESSYPDCVTQLDPVFFPLPMDFAPLTNAFIVNKGKLNQVGPIQNCENLGGDHESQFETAIPMNNGLLPSYNMNLMNDAAVRMGTLQAGKLFSDSNFDDLAMTLVSPPSEGIPPPATIHSLASLAQGGLPTGEIFPEEANIGSAVFMTATFGIAIGDVLTQGFSPVNNNLSAQPAMLLTDCDQDGLDEAIIAVKHQNLQNHELGFMVLENNGNGIEDNNLGNDYHSLPVPIDENSVTRMSLAQGNFSSDLNPKNDLIFAIDATLPGSGAAILCQDTGNCSWDCPNDINDGRVFPLTNGYSNSIAAGDFNGDQRLDVIVTESDAGDTNFIRYLINDGSHNLQNWDTFTFELPTNYDLSYASVVKAGRFSIEAYESNTDEAAVSISQFFAMIDQLEAKILVYPSDGSGNILAPVTLSFSSDEAVAATGFSVVDADQCGGMDILALSHNDDNNPLERRASLFLNINEDPNISVNAATSAELGIPMDLNASCSDITQDARNYTWNVIQSPQNSNPLISKASADLIFPETDASTQITFDLAGDYTVEFTCFDACQAKASEVLLITVEEGGDDGSTTGDPGGNTTGGDTGDTSDDGAATGSISAYTTQGGTLCQLNSQSSLQFSQFVFMCAAFLSFILRSAMKTK